MHRLRAGLLAGRNDFFGLQVAVAAGRRPNVHGLVGQLDMARVFVGVGVNRHSFNAHFSGRFNHAAGDFAAVGNENFCKHIFLALLERNIPVLAPRILKLLAGQHDQ